MGGWKGTTTQSEDYYVTTSQYNEFLNAVAVTKDTHGLYDQRMGGAAETPALIICSETAGGYIPFSNEF